jgi:hypothetical protein
MITMRIPKTLSFAAAAAVAWGTTNVLAQALDPNFTGPARQAVGGAADTTGAPGVQQRIGQREERRDAVRANNGNPNAAVRNESRASNPEAWRMNYHRNQWWYYTPQNRWMYYNNNAWTNYDANSYVAPNNSYSAPRGFAGRRYVSGYRGTYGPPSTPYSNGTPAGNQGSNLGAEVGGAINGAAGANRGAAIGGAIGNSVGAGNAAAQGNPPIVNTAPRDTQPVLTPAPIREPVTIPVSP